MFSLTWANTSQRKHHSGSMESSHDIEVHSESSHPGSAETNPTRNHELAGLIPGLTQWIKDPVAVSWDVGRRRSSDLALLWLWRRPTATSLIRPLTWEPPTCRRCGSKKTKRQKKKKEVRSVLQFPLPLQVMSVSLSTALARPVRTRLTPSFHRC